MQQTTTWRRAVLHTLGQLRLAVESALKHDVFTTAKATAYSAILTLFPALLVVTTVLAIAPEADRIRGAIEVGFYELLPPETVDLVESYFDAPHRSSLQVLWSASLVTVLAAMGVTLSLMDGLHRAHNLPSNVWTFWRTRLVGLALIPICLLPMLFATVLVAFGHPIEHWVIDNADHELRHYVLFMWRIVRWSIALATSVAVFTVIYHFGIPRTYSWKRSLPGAAIATLTWFASTLLYGWYVTRFANYTVVYGSLAAVIATLVWLYMTSFSVLLGGEYNAQNLFALEKQRAASAAQASKEPARVGK